MYTPTRVNNCSINKGGVSINDNVVNTDNNDRVDRPSINNNVVNNANVGINTNRDININNNNGGIDKPSINKPNGAQGKTGTNNINAKRAKFEEDVKKEPILQTILDVFDGELLG